MFTPQEIQEKTFVKAVFGGYDMTSVDDFLEPLSEDYITLYKENAVLKSKMKILVEKLEEYRSQEDSMKKALVAAQKASDQMIAEAEKKCAQMTSQAEHAIRNRTAETQQQIDAEEDRIERARQAAENFIEIIEKDVTRHLDLLNSLKLMTQRAAQAQAQPQPPKAYDFEREQPAEPEAERSDAQEIAAEIEQNLERVIGPGDDGDMDKTRVAAAAPRGAAQGASRNTHGSLKFADLQFGKNYDPNHR